MSETIRERVVRLISEMRNRTTDRGATPAEAAGFAAKIAEWIEKYQIEEAELRAGSGASGAPNIEVCERELKTGKKVFNPGMSQVVNALAQGMCCQAVCFHRGGEAIYGITGDTLDADYVCQVATAVVPALKMMATLEGREHGYEKAGLVRWTNQYLTGAAQEIRCRLEKERMDRSKAKEIESKLAPGGGSGALVVVTGETIAVAKRVAVAAAFKRNHPKTHSTRSRSGYIGAANERGREAGKRVGLNVAIND